MFQKATSNSSFGSAFSIWAVIYHTTVRSVRMGHSSAIVALLMNILQSCMLVAAFYMMFSLLGLKGAKLRGDFILYIMSGIFMYMTHVKAVSAVMSAEGATSKMMQHAPMNTAISIIFAALSALYTQTLSLLVILFAYHTLLNPVYIADPVSALGLFVWSWATGCAVGLVRFALSPWFPTFTSLFATLYRRVQMLASGKMFVANTLPPVVLAMFDWNPLFHIIDQVRGYMFNNYFPRNSDLEYPIYVGIALVMIGLMGEFYTRQHVSSSWSARR